MITMSDDNSASPGPATLSAAPGWFDISTPDSARARGFYRDMFGWSVHQLDETYTLVGSEGAPPSGGIGQAGPTSPYVGVVVYFPVDDVDTALSRAEKLGGTRVMEPQSSPDGRVAVFADPDGNKIGLMSP